MTERQMSDADLDAIFDTLNSEISQAVDQLTDVEAGCRELLSGTDSAPSAVAQNPPELLAFFTEPHRVQRALPRGRGLRDSTAEVLVRDWEKAVAAASDLVDGPCSSSALNDMLVKLRCLTSSAPHISIDSESVASFVLLVPCAWDTTRISILVTRFQHGLCERTLDRDGALHLVQQLEDACTDHRLGAGLSYGPDAVSPVRTTLDHLRRGVDHLFKDGGDFARC